MGFESHRVIHAEELDRFLDVIQFLLVRVIVSILPELYEIVRHHPEVTPELRHLRPIQPGDLKEIDFVIRDKGAKPIRHANGLMQRQRFVPMLSMPEIQDSVTTGYSGALRFSLVSWERYSAPS